MSALATVAEKSFTTNLMRKNDFPIGYFIITDVDIESLKSLHILFDKYLDHLLMKFEQNRMVPTVQNIKMFDKKKMVNHFWTNCWRHVRNFCVWNNYLMPNY